MNSTIAELSKSLHELVLAASLSVHDAGGWLYRAYFLPGDGLLSVLIARAPAVAKFLGLGPGDYGGAVSAFLSGIVWLGGLILLGAAYNFVRDLDRALTARVASAWGETRRLARIGRRRLAIAFRSCLVRRRTAAAVTEVVEESPLGETELTVLARYYDLKPGYVLTARDVAAVIGKDRRQTIKTIAQLKTLRLLESALGTGEGEEAFRMTVTGKAYVEAYHGSTKSSQRAPAA